LRKANTDPAALDLRSVQLLGAKHRPQDVQLRQVQPGIAGKQPRPHAAGQHRRLTGDPPAFGHHPRDPSAGPLDAANSGVGENLRMMIPGRLRNRRRRQSRLRSSVPRRVHPGDELPGRPRHHRFQLPALQQPCVHLVLPRLPQPGILCGDLGLRPAQIHDARLPEAGFPVGVPVQVAPQPQALQRQRYLRRVAPHAAAPAPVPRRLFAADHALFANGDRDALLRQEQRRRNTDDSPADDHHVSPRRQGGIGRNGNDRWRHADLSSRDRGGNLARLAV
jgi:hypothetical protein